MLQGASKAFAEIEAENHAWDSPKAKRLRERRNIVVRHILSLLIDLDTGTKLEITRDLIGDLCCRGSKESCRRAKEAGLSIEPDKLAASGTFFLLRMLFPACCNLLKEGFHDFTSEMVFHTAGAVELLNDLADEEPELFRDIASERIDWPILASRHFPKKANFQRLADRIGLASKTPLRPSSRQTWNPKTPLNQYLIEILLIQCWGNGRKLTKETVPYYLDEILMPLFDKVAIEEEGWENYSEFAAIAKSAAKRGKKGVQRSEIRNRVKKALNAMTR
jgi:hypothetical protein